MKRSLLVNGPFLAGLEVYESWFTNNVKKRGLIPLPGKNESYQGGHAVCIVGYDDDRKLFKFKNSWGAIWGNRGYGYLPYDYMKRYCVDAWSATDLILSPKLIVKKREEVIVKYNKPI
jgi:C1A family cysteine protease